VQHYLDSQNITLSGVVLYGLIAVLVYIGLPMILERAGKTKLKQQTILKLAAVTFFVSLFLPSPLIHGQNTNFVTHVVGGGIFSGLLWLYLKRNYNWNSSWIIELFSLYLLVCGLGVANELMEFAMNGIGLVHIPGNDTWWDLFANTLGAALFWTVYKLFIAKR
jgi:hypothetical protein